MRRAAALLVIWLLSGCTTGTGGGGNIKPSIQTNNVTLYNLNLGIEYMRRGDYDRALEKLNKARQADPNYPLVYNTYAVLYQQLGDFDRAEDNFKRALRLDESSSSTLNNYGRFLCMRNRTEEAEQTFIKAAGNPLYETPEIPYANAGTCVLNAGREADAEQYFRRALEMNPRVAAALLQMARLSYDSGKYLPARGYFQRYSEVADHTAESLWLGIRIEKELGDKDAVSSFALRLKNDFPDSEEARLLVESGTK